MGIETSFFVPFDSEISYAAFYESLWHFMNSWYVGGSRMATYRTIVP